MGRKILVVLGHPDSESFCGALFNAYIDGAKESNSEIREIKIGELQFDPVLWKGYKVIQELEPDLVESQKLIKWADHIVFVYPTWWGTIPSIMKGFIDRTFLPGFAFKFRDNSPFWDKLLAGRTAHLIVTMDTPSWYYRWIYHSPGHNEMKKTVLGFCGIKVNRISAFPMIKNSNQKKRENWLKIVKELGKQA
ncbi:MAG TPA: NAD(P)H-dependent oxidoreductase [Smithella sp.]|nr:NAD(P)H-dependent oxidoreductase [Smithella sp.]